LIGSTIIRRKNVMREKREVELEEKSHVESVWYSCGLKINL
jgi:hypothetical protein